MEEKKTKSNRRTNAVIDKTILKATESIIVQYGFENTTLNAIIKEAGLEPNTFYRRYNDLDDLFDQFVKNYDYFLSDVMKLKASENAVDENFVATRLKDLANRLYSNEVMQKILIWELSSSNATTQRIAKEREDYSKKLLDNIDQLFPGLDFNLKAYISIMIGGIYYLILHKDMSTFCGVDFSKRTGKKVLLDTIQTITDKVLSEKNSNKQLLDIAGKMKQEKIQNEVIARVTGLSVNIIEEI